MKETSRTRTRKQEEVIKFISYQGRNCYIWYDMYHHSNSGIRKPQNKSKNRDILSRYEIIENPRNLPFRFTLCMQEFFESIPQDQWKIKRSCFYQAI